MIYPNDFEKKIGFDILRQMLEKRCVSAIGIKNCKSVRFSSSIDEIKARLAEISQMQSIIDKSTTLPLNNIEDTSEWMLHLSIQGNHLEEEKLLRIAKMIATAQQLKSIFSNNDILINYPELYKLFSKFPDLSIVKNEICRIVSENFTVKDNASSELFSIRRDIIAASNAVSGAMKKVIDNAISKGILSTDVVPAVREGHLVIPVTGAQRRKLPGIVLDQSATGKTFYVEPVEVVEANNRIRELKIKENKEIILILSQLAAFLRPYIPQINETSKILGRYDMIRAKALLAIDLNAELPHLSPKPELEWYNAIHPILFFALQKNERTVVPLDIVLNEKNRILIISGPNAGGKSVALKTVAIVQYMMQCGLMPPLYRNSHMGIFRNIFIDIGDEQSLENDLSTYSSHLKNMKYFVTHSSHDSLILADEMGSGTEPQIGGAIAQAIIAKINQLGAYGIITTHYQNLKTFANSQHGLVNGAMLYDRQHLRPLFQLSIGSPGSSFALEIARKSGLPEDIIQNAKEIVGSEYVYIDKYILDLTRDRKYWAAKRIAIKEKEAKIDNLITQLQNKTDDIKNKRAEYINQARTEAKEILKQANAKIENTVREIKESQAQKDKTKAVREQLEEYRKQIESATANQKDTNKDLNIDTILRRKKNNQTIKTQEINRKAIKQPNIQEGSYVKMPSGATVGKVISINGNQAQVAFGSLRTYIKTDELEIIDSTKTPFQSSNTTSALSKETYEASRKRQLNFKSDLDLRGFRVDEALQAVTYFIDDALQFGIDKLRILHGTGTGALKSAIRQMLQANPNVQNFHDEDVRLGGAGITIVNLQ